MLEKLLARHRKSAPTDAAQQKNHVKKNFASRRFFSPRMDFFAREDAIPTTRRRFFDSM